MSFSIAGLMVGAPGSEPQIEMLEDPEIEVLVAGESREWETVEYARDAAQQNRNKALILLGHLNSEEAGMKWCAGWLKNFIHEVPVRYMSSKDPFRTVHE